MSFKMTDTSQNIRVFNFLDGTGEFIGAGDAYIPAHTGLPAHCTDIKPPVVNAGYTVVFNTKNSTWSIVEDHRGKTVYETETGNPIYISELGPLPGNVTNVSPDGEYQKWSGMEWVNDEEAEKAAKVREAEETKRNLLQIAAAHIAPLQDAVDLDIATDEEKTLLLTWKKYRVLLNRIDTTEPEKIVWPEKP